MRQLISSGSPYEARFGFSRAVRVGPIVTIAGTAPLDAQGRTVAVGDVAQQARRCVQIIAAALAQAGAGLPHVVRTRVLLLHIEDWPQVAPVHGEYFAAIRPVTSVLQVARFIDPEWLVEFEADAVLEQTP
jgi:enamine deaminase RidA (YjgF/YER057c/UK114 family)